MASFHELEKGKYKLFVEFGYRGSKRLRKTKVVYVKNKTEAKRELLLFEAELLSKQIIEEENITLEQFYPKWIINFAVDHYSPSTLDSRSSIIDTRIMPEFGKVRLKDITRFDVIDFIKEQKPIDKKKTDLSPSSIHNIYKSFNSLMQVATDWELIESNPCDKIKLPSLSYKESDVYNVEQTKALFERLENYDISKQLIVKIAALSGARQGEIVALENKHFNFNKNTILFEQAFVNPREKGLVLKETKTKNKRTVSIPNDLMRSIEKYMKIKKKQLFEMQNLREWPNHIFIFSDEFGKPLRPDSVSQWWIRFMKSNSDLKRIRFHDLRHTSATLLILQGVHAKVIQKRLGHTQITTTLDTYSHVLEEMDQTAADEFENMFDDKTDKTSDQK